MANHDSSEGPEFYYQHRLSSALSRKTSHNVLADVGKHRYNVKHPRLKGLWGE